MRPETQRNNEVESAEVIRFRWVEIHAPMQHSKNGDGLARLIDLIKDEERVSCD